MPKGPKGEKRPADVIGNAVHVMRIATGEAEEGQEPENPAAVLGRRGGAARARLRARAARHSPDWAGPGDLDHVARTPSGSVGARQSSAGNLSVKD